MTPKTEPHFRRIGQGFCGSVWSPNSKADDPCFMKAFKREDGGPGRSLAKDFEMHGRVVEAREQFMTNADRGFDIHIQVPYRYRFIRGCDEPPSWWEEKFPAGCSPCNVLVAERIPPVPEDIRAMLIDKYCPEPLVPEIKASDANRDCLIRPYLGRRRVASTRPSLFRAFSLRNYPLHIDQMEELGIGFSDQVTYSHIMAEALAMMHWYGEIDANDVEFVLAPPRNGQTATISNNLGSHVMWLLDFDCCNKMQMDEQGIEQAVTAFLRNDPFYPRMASSPALWEEFRSKYLQTSTEILQRRQMRKDLPGMFIEKVEMRQQEAAAQN
ncbi:hypothetical protein FQN51_006643 [Onygenales sp. PD_10]|nr:hypothetical protein FQN51_006643 [Onygenales sp. PD_10]